MLSLNYENINYVMTQILKLSCVSFSYVSISYVLAVAGPVIQANRRLTFEDDLRSGGLLCFISMNASVRTEFADSMVTPGKPGGD